MVAVRLLRFVLVLVGDRCNTFDMGPSVRHTLLLAFAVFIAVPARAQTGFLDRTIATGGESYRYQVYVPADYSPNANWPVVVSLHGNGRQGADGMQQTGTDFAVETRYPGENAN